METFDINAFGKRLLKLREKINLNQQEMATAINVTTKTLSKYENAENAPKIDLIARLVRYTKCNPYWLIFGEGDIFDDEDLIEKIFRDVQIDEKLLEIIEVLRNPKLSIVMRNEFQNKLIMAQKEYSKLFEGTSIGSVYSQKI